MRRIILIALPLLLGFGGTLTYKRLSIEELGKDPKYPHWAAKKQVNEYPNKQWRVFNDSRKNATNMKRNCGKLRYHIDKYDKSNNRPFMIYQLGRHFTDLDHDVAAYYNLQQLLNLPDNTPHNSRIYRMPNLNAAKNEGRYLSARILARNGHGKEVDDIFKSLNPNNGYDKIRKAEILALLGKTDQAIKLLENLDAKGHPESNFGDSFIRMRTTVLARTIGRDDLAKKISSSILSRGEKSQKWPQWQSSWAIMNTIKENIDTGKSAEFKDLKDGTYSAECRGFVSEIKVKATVKDNKLESLKIIRSRENRPWSALESIPNRIVRRQSLNVDCVTGATVSSCAIIAATDKALLSAKK